MSSSTVALATVSTAQVAIAQRKTAIYGNQLIAEMKGIQKQ
jgi:hypothetical protein